MILVVLHIFTSCYMIVIVRRASANSDQLRDLPRHLFGLIKTHISPKLEQPPLRVWLFFTD